MLRVLVYDTDAAFRSRICSAARSIFAQVGLGGGNMVRSSSLDALSSAVRDARPNYFDIIVCHMGACQEEARALLEFIGSDSPNTALVIIADDPACALNAFAVGASGFCLVKDGEEGFRSALVPLARRIEEKRRGNTVGLRSAAGVANVPLDDITFIESGKRGSIIHLAVGKTLLVRMPLTVLYERLAPKGAFALAGRSFIVNFGNVRSVGEGTVLFSDGESIIVPVRVRKSISAAFEDSWKRGLMLYTEYSDEVNGWAS